MSMLLIKGGSVVAPEALRSFQADILVRDGVIEEMGTPDQVFGSPRSEKTRSFLRGTQEKF